MTMNAHDLHAGMDKLREAKAVLYHPDMGNLVNRCMGHAHTTIDYDRNTLQAFESVRSFVRQVLHRAEYLDSETRRIADEIEHRKGVAKAAVLKNAAAESREE